MFFFVHSFCCCLKSIYVCFIYFNVYLSESFNIRGVLNIPFLLFLLESGHSVNDFRLDFQCLCVHRCSQCICVSQWVYGYADIQTFTVSVSVCASLFTVYLCISVSLWSCRHTDLTVYLCISVGLWSCRHTDLTAYLCISVSLTMQTYRLHRVFVYISEFDHADIPNILLLSLLKYYVSNCRPYLQYLCVHYCLQYICVFQWV